MKQQTKMKTVLLFAALSATFACSEALVEEDSYTLREQALTGISSSWNKNNIMSDGVFSGSNYAMNSVDLVQQFLEKTPYNKRCWLADHTINGKSAAQALVDAGQKHNVNPLVLLVRMQAEMGLISKSSRPTNERHVNYAFGCGCPDNQACDPQYKGLDKQLECGAKFLRKNFERSANKEGTYFHTGKTKSTLDGTSVTPENDATAAHYNYTPHAGSPSNQTGAYLTWVILKRYANHLATLDPNSVNGNGTQNMGDPTNGAGDPNNNVTDPDNGTMNGGVTNPDPNASGTNTMSTGWIGESCAEISDCKIPGAPFALCLPTKENVGMCTSTCAGLCPSSNGSAPTFCISLDGGDSGTCVQQATPQNNNCTTLAGTKLETRQRFIKYSDAPPATMSVCVPIPAVETAPDMDPGTMDPTMQTTDPNGQTTQITNTTTVNGPTLNGPTINPPTPPTPPGCQAANTGSPIQDGGLLLAFFGLLLGFKRRKDS